MFRRNIAIFEGSSSLHIVFFKSNFNRAMITDSFIQVHSFTSRHISEPFIVDKHPINLWVYSPVSISIIPSISRSIVCQFNKTTCVNTCLESITSAQETGFPLIYPHYSWQLKFPTTSQVMGLLVLCILVPPIKTFLP